MKIQPRAWVVSREGEGSSAGWGGGGGGGGVLRERL